MISPKEEKSAKTVVKSARIPLYGISRDYFFKG